MEFQNENQTLKAEKEAESERLKHMREDLEMEKVSRSKQFQLLLLFNNGSELEVVH